jgi:hypothetical protein
VPWGYQWSTHQWSDIVAIPTIVGDSVVRQYKKTNKLVNALLFVVTSSSIVDYFELLELGAEGYLVKVDPPRAWKTGDVQVIDPAVITDEDGNAILV